MTSAPRRSPPWRSWRGLAALAEDDRLEQLLARPRRERQPVIVLVGHDRARVITPATPSLRAGLIAADLQLALHRARHLRLAGGLSSAHSQRPSAAEVEALERRSGSRGRSIEPVSPNSAASMAAMFQASLALTRRARRTASARLHEEDIGGNAAGQHQEGKKLQRHPVGSMTTPLRAAYYVRAV